MSFWQLPDGTGRPEPDPASPETRRIGAPALIVRVALTVALGAGLWHWLHRPWAPLLWLALISTWFTAFMPERFPRLRFEPRSVLALLAVTAVAVASRTYRIGELPHGPYIDELLIYLHTIKLTEQHLDLFGQVPLSREGWVQTANLYLHCNALILKFCGAGYFGMKMLSVVPGVLAAIAVYLTCCQLWRPRAALLAGCWFAVSTWPVRLSRYGWDVSFTVMAFACAIWLLVRARSTRHHLPVFLAGCAGGIGLFSNVAARVCVLSLVAYLALDCLLARRRFAFARLAAFVAAVAATSLPLVWYYLENPPALTVRTEELSIFGRENWMELLIQNLRGHAGMFHWLGGTYARDNFPGAPMMDVLSGLLLIVGLVFAVRRIDIPLCRLLLVTFFVDFAGGIFSVSQEGPPYVYRTAATMVPAFLLAALGLQFLAARLGGRARRRLPTAVVALSCALNLWMYFGREPHNLANTRVTAYPLRLVLEEFDAARHPAYLLGGDVFRPAETDHYPGEEHVDSNATMATGPQQSSTALFFLSSAYDPTASLRQNLRRKDSRILLRARFLAPGFRPPRPSVLIFSARNAELLAAVRRLPGAGAVRTVDDPIGRPLLGVVTIE